MNGKQFPQAYRDLLKVGPFPGRMDPWAEDGRYFQQIHAGMIGYLMEHLQEPLDVLGYVAGRETSLQVAEQRRPDLYVEHQETAPAKPVMRWDYVTAASEILAEPGVALDLGISELDAIYVRESETALLVTVVEIVSPRNKTDQNEIIEYQNRRERLLRNGINLMEIDLTRSVKRLLGDKMGELYPYHIAVYLPEELPRFIGVDFGQPLKRVALPLRGEVVGMELQAAYDYAYLAARIPIHIRNEDSYGEKDLPFRSLLTPQQRQEALTAVAQWQAELERLRNES